MTEQKKSTLPYQVILMLVIVLGVILAGFLLFPQSPEESRELLSRLGTTNQGVLLTPPKPLSALELTNEVGQEWQLQDHQHKWRLIIPVAGECGETCQDLLYTSRQVHIRLAKHADRIERVYLSLNGDLSAETREFLAAEHPYLKVLYSDTADFERWLADTNAGWHADMGRIFVVDQRGYGMLYYTPEHEGNQMLEDLLHLLKYSPN